MATKRNLSACFGLACCVLALACSGCQSRKVLVHGQSGIISRDAQQRLGRLAIEGATEGDVLSLLGEPFDRPVEEDGRRSLYYSCVVTTLKEHYLFSRNATTAAWQNTDMHTCRVYLGPEGGVRFVDYRHGTSNKNMRPIPLPRPY